MELSDVRAKLEAIVGPGAVRRDEPLSLHTSFEVGGPADLFVEPSSEAEFLAVLDAAEGVPAFILGKGSDLLVSDAGVRGCVVSTERLSDLVIDGTRIHASSGLSLKALAEAAADASLTGLEFASGIPGSVGGAIFMNAGAYDGCMADVTESVRVRMPDGSLANLAASELDFGYRRSRVRTEGLTVLDATFALEPGERSAIRAKMDDLWERRVSKQPLEFPSAGSTFKRPPGHFAGKLISDAGLKGRRIGGAQVSEKHAGFIINTGGATAADVSALIDLVIAEVEDAFGVTLEPEVRRIGEF